MPRYIDNALQLFNHMRLNHSQNQPLNMSPAIMKQNSNMQNPRQTLPLGKEDEIFIMQVTGVFLFLGRAVDSTLSMPLSAIASGQANPTEETMEKCKQFLDYVATHEEAVLAFRASDTILPIHSDVSYISETNAQSRAEGVLHTKRRGNPTKQRSLPKHFANNKDSGEFRSRSRVGSIIRQWKISSPHPQTTLVKLWHPQNTNANRQFNSARCSHQ